MILAQPDERYNNRTTVVIDFSNAYGQGDAWREDEIKRFLKNYQPCYQAGGILERMQADIRGAICREQLGRDHLQISEGGDWDDARG